MRSHPIVLIAVAMLLAGCQPTASTPPQKAPIAVTPLPTNRPPTADEAVASDPCSTRLHDIEGALLMYYLVNKQLPATLDQIKPFADAGTELVLTCPVSNKPYVYSAEGLLAAGYDKRIIVWDPAPVHKGSRWCIVMQRPHPGEALVAEVIQVPEKAFAAFVPAIQ
jgi:hypothetical protein